MKFWTVPCGSSVAVWADHHARTISANMEQMVGEIYQGVGVNQLS